ncbi:MAG TPA: PEGA domain-containing protein [Pirellulales bacterium]|jgi:hypothetical protein|nr:PEGA domain-containing protein [Pirellulales bacterium]
MATEFNPYHVWLGIPPEELPANHYRLLGIRLFESNGDVIDNAADRQMAHLRTFQGGKHGELTQRLLNEVAAARVCLLDPKKRAAYDPQLKAKMSAASADGAPAGGSAIQRQAPRRPAATLAAAGQASHAAPANSAAAPQPANVWDDLLGGDPAARSSQTGAKTAKATAAKLATAKAAAVKRNASNRNVSIGIAAAIVLAAAVGIGLYAMSGTPANADATIVFNWPAADRAEASLTVDDARIAIPATAKWEYRCPPGFHHIAGQHAAYKFSADVTLVAGQEQTLSPDWRPKAVLVLNWPPAERAGAELKIDGHPQTVTRRVPLEIPVAPGQHLVQVTGPGTASFGTTVSVTPDGRELVAIAPPPTTGTLVFDWPAEERRGAELTVDGHRQEAASGTGADPFQLTVEPGRHVVRIVRAGFEPFSQSVEISAGANQAIKPTWAPEQKAAVVETPLDTAPQPLKKLSPPPAADIERIAKQIENLYKTTGAGLKDPAKAQELYDVAAKDGSSPAERYVLLTKGAEIAAAGGDLTLAMQGADALAAAYEIGPFELKQKLLDKYISVAKPDQEEAAISVAEQLVNQAIAGDQYEIALVLATAASRAAAKSQLPTRKEIEDQLSKRRHDIRIIAPLYAAAKKARAALAKTPDDPEANKLVGQWNCFYKSDWAAGLPLLAKGSDEKLKSLAAEDLMAELKSPTDAEGKIHLADAWWELAQKEAGAARDSIRLHAGEIYQAALPNLGSALKKAAIEKRLTEIADLQTAAANAASATSAPAVATGKSKARGKLPMGKMVEILQLVDPANAIEGNWSRDGDKLMIQPGNQCRIAIPVVVEGSYDMEVEFTRHDGDGDLHFTIPVGTHHCDVMVGQDKRTGGLDTVNGRRPSENSNPTTVHSPEIENDHTYRLLVKVRVQQADAASIDVLLDGKPYLPHWEGDAANLNIVNDWAMPAGHLGLGAWQSHVAYTSVKLRMISGRADTAGGAEAQAASATAAGEAPASLKGRFFVACKGEVELFINGRPLPISDSASESVRLSQGDIVALRISSKFVHRTFRAAFLPDNRKWKWPFRQADFSVFGDADPSSIQPPQFTASLSRAGHGKANDTIEMIWKRLDLPSESEWIWSGGKDTKTTVAAIVSPALFMPNRPAR